MASAIVVHGAQAARCRRTRTRITAAANSCAPTRTPYQVTSSTAGSGPGASATIEPRVTSNAAAHVDPRTSADARGAVASEAMAPAIDVPAGALSPDVSSL